MKIKDFFQVPPLHYRPIFTSYLVLFSHLIKIPWISTDAEQLFLILCSLRGEDCLKHTFQQGQRRLRLPQVIPSVLSLLLFILKCRFWKYGVYRNNINDQATSTFGGTYETMFTIIKKSTESTTHCVLNMGSLHPCRRNNWKAIILIKLWCSVTIFHQAFWASCCVRHYSTRDCFPGYTLAPGKCITVLTFLKYSIFCPTTCFLVPPFPGFPFPRNWNKYSLSD